MGEDGITPGKAQHTQSVNVCWGSMDSMNEGDAESLAVIQMRIYPVRLALGFDSKRRVETRDNQ